MILHNLCPNRWYNKWFKAKNRIKSCWLKLNGKSDFCKQKSIFQEELVKVVESWSPCWSHRQLWLLEKQKGDPENFISSHSTKKLFVVLYSQVYYNKICVFGFCPMFLAQSFKNLWNFLSDGSAFSNSHNMPILTMSLCYQGDSCWAHRKSQQGAGQTYKGVETFWPASQHLWRGEDLEIEFNYMANNIIHTYVMRLQ